MEGTERIYGVDQGNLSQEVIDDFNSSLQSNPKRAELIAYVAFDHLDWFCWAYNHMRPGGEYNIPHTDETNKEYIESNYARHYVIGLTKNFGVTFEKSNEKMKAYMSESFTKWYHFWKDYIEGLSEDVWKKLDRALCKGLDLSEYMPKNSWND